MSVRSRASSYASLVNNNNSTNASDPAWRPRGSSPTNNDEVPPLILFSQFTGLKNKKPLPPPFWPVVPRSKMPPVDNSYIQLINYKNNESERLLSNNNNNNGKYNTFKKRKGRKNRKSRKSRI